MMTRFSLPGFITRSPFPGSAPLSFAGLLLVACHMIVFGQAQAQTDSAGLRLKSPFAYELATAGLNPGGTVLVRVSKGARVTLHDLRNLGTSEPLRDDETIWLPEKDIRISRGYAVAMHRSNQFIAASLPPRAATDGAADYVAGTAEILLYKRQPETGGKLIFKIYGLPAPVAALTFAPDGTTLAAVFADGCGIKLWDLTENEDELAYGIPWQDSDGYGGPDGHAATCRNPGPDTARAELPDGSDVTFVQLGERRYAVASSDTGVWVYERRAGAPGWRRAGGLPTSELHLVSPAKLSFDGQRLLAVGDSKSLRLSVLHFNEAGSDPLLTLVSSHSFDHLLDDARSLKASLQTVLWADLGNRKVLLAGGWLITNILRQSLFADHLGRILPRYGEVQHILAIPADTLLSFPQDRPLQPFTDFDVILGHRDGINSLLSGGPRGQPLVVSQRALLTIPPAAVAGVPTWAAEPVSAAGSLDFRDSLGGLYLSDDGRQLAFTARAKGNRSVGLFFSLPDLAEMQVRTSSENAARDGEDIKEELASGVAAAFRPAEAAVSGVSAGPTHLGTELGKLLRQFGPRIANPETYKSVNGYPLRFEGGPLDGYRPDPEDRSLSMGQLVPRGGEDEGAAGYAWATDRALFLVAGDGRVTCRLPIDSGATRLVGSRDGMLIVAAHMDGTLRWYRIGARREGQGCLTPILSLYAEERNDQTWSYVTWLPDGHFAFRGTGGLGSMMCWYEGLPPPRSGSCDNGGRIYKEKENDNAVRAATIASAPTPEPASALKRDFFVEFLRPRRGMDEFTLDTGEPLIFKIAPVAGGRLPRFARVLGRSSQDGGIIDASIGGIRYGWGVFPVSSGAPIELALTLPARLRVKENQQWQLCLEFFAADVDGRPALETPLKPRPAADEECSLVTWKGTPEGQADRKLWGIILGFSGAKRQAAGLNFAHDDALDFARLLLETFVAQQRDPATAARSDFSALQLDILVTPPGVWRSDQSTPLSAKLIELMSRYRELQRDPLIGGKIDIKFRRINDIVQGKESRLIRSVILDDMFSRITAAVPLSSADRREGTLRDEDVVLFYYSGHGFTGVEGGGAELTLAMPDADVSDSSLHISFTDLVRELNDIKHGIKLMVIDACRTPVGFPGAIQAFNSQKALSKLQEALKSMYGAWHILLSNAEPRSSYEQDIISFANLYPALWSEGVRNISKGNGVFSLSMLHALTCPEAGCLNEDCVDGIPKHIMVEDVKGFHNKYTQSRAFSYWPLIRQQLAGNTGSAQAPKIVADSSPLDPSLPLRTLPLTAPWCFARQ